MTRAESGVGQILVEVGPAESKMTYFNLIQLFLGLTA
jgi:hypothetical protein